MIIEDRVINLEKVLAKFMEQTSLVIVAIHEEIDELRASNVRTDRHLLAMQVQADKDRQQAEMDRQQAERVRQEDREQSERARREDRDLAVKVREQDREQAEKTWQQYNEQTDKAWRQYIDQAEKAWQRYIVQVDRARREDFERAERVRQQDRELAEKARELDREKTEKALQQDRERAEKARELEREKMEKALQQDRERAEKYWQQAQQDRKDFNKRLAEISDSMGTLIEDMVGMRLAEAIFRDESADTCAIRVRRKHPVKKGEMIELDLLAVGQTKLLFVEVKRHVDPEKAAQLRKKAALIPEFFPEYRDRAVHCAVASVYLDPSMISFLNHQKFYGIAMGDDTMEVVNLGQF